MQNVEPTKRVLSLAFERKLPTNNLFSGLLEGTLDRILHLRKLDDFYARVAGANFDIPFVDRILKELDLQYELGDKDSMQIPRTGPLVVISNHPLGMVDGILLGSIFRTIRPDFKMLANNALNTVPELRDTLIHVDPYGGATAAKSNTRPVKEAIRWLRNGGSLGIFPAGEVAHFNLAKRQVTDPQWNPSVARIIRKTRAQVLAVFIDGSNSLVFQLTGLIHAGLRTAMLPRELLNKRGRMIKVRISSPIPIERLEAFESNAEMIGYLRRRTYLLANQIPPSSLAKNASSVASHRSQLQPVPRAIPPSVMSDEIAALPPAQELVTNAPFSVYYANAEQIPFGLREIGRLREVAFRNANEGTGKALDIDQYDSYYLQLFLWNREAKEIVGAYRIGRADKIVAHFGKRGLYTYSLFRYGSDFVDRINPSLELGRSFVRVEYQKSFPPLFLLWKGIARFVALHPQYKTLFGPVTISSDYRPVARRFLVECLTRPHHRHELAAMVKARTPFKDRSISARALRDWSDSLDDFDEVSELVSDIETDRRSVPVLLKQYLKLGGKLLAFNVDQKFSDALDGLIIVDLTKVDVRMLNRLMGPASTEGFLQSHKPGYLLAS